MKVWRGKVIAKIMICEWCGFIDDKDLLDEYKMEANFQCPCCGLYDVEIAES